MALLVQSRLPTNGTISKMPVVVRRVSVEHPRAAVDARALHDQIGEALRARTSAVGVDAGVELVVTTYDSRNDAQERARVDELIAIELAQHEDLRPRPRDPRCARASTRAEMPHPAESKNQQSARNCSRGSRSSPRRAASRAPARITLEVALERLVARVEPEAPALIVRGARREHAHRDVVASSAESRIPAATSRNVPSPPIVMTHAIRAVVERVASRRRWSCPSGSVARKSHATPAVRKNVPRALDALLVLAALRRRVADEEMRPTHESNDKMNPCDARGFFLRLVACFACDSGDGSGPRDSGVASDGAVEQTPQCQSQGGTAPVAQPTFVRNIKTGETGWFSSPAVVDLDKNGNEGDRRAVLLDVRLRRAGQASSRRARPRAVASTRRASSRISTATARWRSSSAAATARNKGRASSPTSGRTARSPRRAAGPRRRAAADSAPRCAAWPRAISTATARSRSSSRPPTRATRARRSSSSRPTGACEAAGRATTRATTTTFNGKGNNGYGCYGENVGIGNIDDDERSRDPRHVRQSPDQRLQAGRHVDPRERLVHEPASQYVGQRMGWGQFIRWFDPTVEDNHYHLDPNGAWPSVDTTMWLQWTASPPNVVDIDGDGKNDVVGIPNAERSSRTRRRATRSWCSQGAQGGGANAARRLPAFNTLPFSDKPAVRASRRLLPARRHPGADDREHPRRRAARRSSRRSTTATSTPSAPTARASGATTTPRARRRPSPPRSTVADLNKDGTPELVFGTYSLQTNGGHLVVLANTGALLFDIPLPNQGTNGNGIGVPAAPTDRRPRRRRAARDPRRDVRPRHRRLHRAGLGHACMLWPTGRGSNLRAGRPITQ